MKLYLYCFSCSKSGSSAHSTMRGPPSGLKLNWDPDADIAEHSNAVAGEEKVSNNGTSAESDSREDGDDRKELGIV